MNDRGPQSTILLVEDEPAIAESVVYALTSEGYRIRAAATLVEARRLFGTETPDLVVLDVNLPDGNGFEFCRQTGLGGRVPVIFLTSRSSEIDRIVGLELGGGDYLTKPFSPRELAARVRNLLRNASRPGPVPAPPSRLLEIDEVRARVLWQGREIPVSASEFRLLRILAGQPGRVFTRDQLLEGAWDDPGASLDRTIDSHIKNLRAKFRNCDRRADPIRTHRGLGYSLDEEAVR